MITRPFPPGLAAVLAVALSSAAASAQDNPRFGVWQMDSDRPAPYKNIMTYEPYQGDGMRVTVATTNAQGQENAWGYVTLFDGVFRPVEGQQNAQTAVEYVDDRTTPILNQRNGRVTQVIINTLTDDGDAINNEYVRLDENGDIVGVSHAVYRRIG